MPTQDHCFSPCSPLFWLFLLPALWGLEMQVEQLVLYWWQHWNCVWLPGCSLAVVRAAVCLSNRLLLKSELHFLILSVFLIRLICWNLFFNWKTIGDGCLLGGGVLMVLSILRRIFLCRFLNLWFFYNWLNFRDHKMAGSWETIASVPDLINLIFRSLNLGLKWLTRKADINSCRYELVISSSKAACRFVVFVFLDDESMSVGRPHKN